MDEPKIHRRYERSECHRQALRSLAADILAVPVIAEKSESRARLTGRCAIASEVMVMVALCRAVTVIMVVGIGIMSARSEPIGVDGSKPTASDHDWTILVMAPDGSWGVATKTFIYQAIADAMSKCRRMSGQRLGCGTQIQAAKNDWILAIRCRSTNIIVTGATIAEAIKSAVTREMSLRVAASEDVSCVQVVTVTPQGLAVRAVPDTPWEVQERESATRKDR